MTGTTVSAETIDVATGWNLVGSISSPVPTSSITSIPPGIISGGTFSGGGTFFGFSGGYNIAPTDIPFRGYWVRCNSPGKIILSSKGSKRPKPLTTVADLNSFDVLRIEDAGGHRQTLYFGTQRDENIQNDHDGFPPGPPEGVFDADHPSDRLTEIPKQFTLEQSFPNPFNPTTTIRYQLPVDSKLKIYSTLGQTVQVLADGFKTAGFEAVVWEADALPSGVYFYKLEAVSVSDRAHRFTQVRKALLLR